VFRRRAHRGRGGRAVVAGGVVRRTARRRGDGDGRSGCASAATPRPVMMTAAEVAVSAPCAQACTASTRQVATSATQRTATQAPEVCGTASSDRAPHTPAATPTDAVVTPTAFVGVAQALRAVMCPAAPVRVSSAPVLSDPPGEEARLPAAVTCSPVVWSRNPAASSPPNTTSRHRSVRDRARTRRADTARSTTAANPKRHNRNVAGASSAREGFVTTKGRTPRCGREQQRT